MTIKDIDNTKQINCIKGSVKVVNFFVFYSFHFENVVDKVNTDLFRSNWTMGNQYIFQNVKMKHIKVRNEIMYHCLLSNMKFKKDVPFSETDSDKLVLLLFLFHEPFLEQIHGLFDILAPHTP